MSVLKIQEIPCVFCGTTLQSMDTAFDVTKSTPLENGVFGFLEAVHGSKHEGDEFVLAVCDKCLEGIPARIVHIKQSDKDAKIKYFHELTQEEVDSLMSTNISLLTLNNLYKKPVWCGMKGALNITTGCSQLMDWKEDGGRTAISRDFCKTCDQFKHT